MLKIGTRAHVKWIGYNCSQKLQGPWASPSYGGIHNSRDAKAMAETSLLSITTIRNNCGEDKRHVVLCGGGDVDQPGWQLTFTISPSQTSIRVHLVISISISLKVN